MSRHHIPCLYGIISYYTSYKNNEASSWNKELRIIIQSWKEYPNTENISDGQHDFGISFFDNKKNLDLNQEYDWKFSEIKLRIRISEICENENFLEIVPKNQLEIILKLLKSNLENHQYQLLCILFIKAFPSNSAHLSISKELILATCNLKTENLQRYCSKSLQFS